mgnify:CR=1 FL=1
MNLVTADTNRISILGERKFLVDVAGRKTYFPFVIMRNSLIDCIIGYDLLSSLKAVIHVDRNELEISGIPDRIKFNSVQEFRTEVN